MELIIEWSQRMNIVSRNDLPVLLERHILDSLVPLPEIPDTGSLIDIGSGAGFPAIPIALMRPRLEIVMVESTHKKTLFLNEAISRLELTQAIVWNGRFEEYYPQNRFDIATIRAVKLTEKIRNALDRSMHKNSKVIYYNKFGQYELIHPENR